MTAKAYTTRYVRQGLAGNTQMVITVFNCSTGDTVSFGSDLSKLQAVAYLGRSNGAASLETIASTIGTGGWTSQTITIPSTPSVAADDIDILVLGPALTTS